MHLPRTIAAVGAAVAIAVAAASERGSGSQQVPPAPLAICQMRDAYPDPLCTPGAINPEMTVDVLCAAGFTTRSVRPPVSYTDALKYRQMVAYGFATDEADARAKSADYEEDHFIPLTVGGHPTDPNNLWPERRSGPGGALEKDKVESAAGRAVCAGTLSLSAAQSGIATDWLAFGRELGVIDR